MSLPDQHPVDLGGGGEFLVTAVQFLETPHDPDS